MLRNAGRVGARRRLETSLPISSQSHTTQSARLSFSILFISLSLSLPYTIQQQFLPRRQSLVHIAASLDKGASTSRGQVQPKPPVESVDERKRKQPTNSTTVVDGCTTSPHQVAAGAAPDTTHCPCSRPNKDHGAQISLDPGRLSPKTHEQPHFPPWNRHILSRCTRCFWPGYAQ